MNQSFPDRQNKIYGKKFQTFAIFFVAPFSLF